MSDEPPELDPETAERLIAGARAGELDPDLVPLAELLAAATAPAHPDDLTGMDAALVAFRQARHTGEAPADRGAFVGRILTLQGLAVTLVVGVLGGGALAAATGALPVSLPADRPMGTASPPPADTFATVTPGARGPGQISAPASRTVPPREALIGWCRAATAAGKKSASHPAPLVEAAGGSKQVHAYCARLLRARPSKQQDSPKAKRSTPSPARPASR